MDANDHEAMIDRKHGVRGGLRWASLPESRASPLSNGAGFGDSHFIRGLFKNPLAQEGAGMGAIDRPREIVLTRQAE